MKALTIKQDKFARLVVSLGNQAEAYRQAYNVTSSNSRGTIYPKASRLAKKLKEHIEAIRLKGGYTITPTKVPTTGYIYIIDIKGFNYYKVGISQQPKVRIIDLRTLVPFEMSLVREIYVENYKQIEKDIHTELSEYHVKGEWFDCNIDRINNIFDKYEEVNR